MYGSIREVPKGWHILDGQEGYISDNEENKSESDSCNDDQNTDTDQNFESETKESSKKVRKLTAKQKYQDEAYISQGYRTQGSKSYLKARFYFSDPKNVEKVYNSIISKEQNSEESKIQ